MGGVFFVTVITILGCYLIDRDEKIPHGVESLYKRYFELLSEAAKFEDNIENTQIEGVKRLSEAAKFEDNIKNTQIEGVKRLYEEQGIYIQGNFDLKENRNLATMINEDFKNQLVDMLLREYRYLEINIGEVTIGRLVEEYLREKKVNLESAERIFVKLKLQKNKNPEVSGIIF
jgi:hypothetical protein